MREWLLMHRQDKGMTHEEVATICGISRQFYSMIENGERKPSVNTAKKIANALGFKWTKFYEEDPKNF